MLKYILFAILVVLLVCNYLSVKVLTLVLKKEPTQNQNMAYKLILYVITLAIAIYTMVI